MALRRILGSPGLELEKSGKPMRAGGHVWQTYQAKDPDDPRVWEHDETAGVWYFLIGSDEP